MTNPPNPQGVTLREAKADQQDWYAQMHQTQAELSTMAVNECNKLRYRVRDLESQISQMPSNITELQDRVVLLESLLQERTA